MDWSKSWMWNAEHLEKDSNWTSPFFKSVFCSINDSLVKPQNKFSGTSIFSSLSPAEQCGIVFPIFLAVIIKNLFINKDYLNGKNKVTLSWPQFINPKSFFIILSFVIFSILLPVILLTLTLAYFNRIIVNILLKKKHGNNFIRLLVGTDTIWALEEDNARSIINVITTIEVDSNVNDSSNGILLNKLKETIRQKFFTGKCPYPKMFYKRSFEKGYYFWEKHVNLCIDDYVRPMNIDEKLEMNNDNLHKFVSENANTKLPFDNTASWEVLISDRPMNKSEDEELNIEIYPLLFRIHHSLGDGVVLMKLLLKTIADEDLDVKTENKKLISKVSVIKYITDTFSLKKIQSISLARGLRKGFYNILTKIMLLIMAPASLMSQVLRPPDSNTLHGPALNGNKVCAWVSDGLIEESLLVRIKRVKSRIPGVTFSDIFLTALSASYHNYFTQCCLLDKPLIPEYMTAVVPVQVNKSDLTLKAEIADKKLKLQNRFSVAMLTVPITIADCGDGINFSLLKRLVEVRKQTSRMRCSADFYVNYWIMSVASQLLPEPMLRPILYSEQATLVISNLPGPTNIKICGGYVRDMAFFVPHRGTTGMGVTLLTCGGRVNLGLMADSSLISCSEDAEAILKGAVEEIKALDIFTSRRMQSHENGMEICSS